MHTYWQLFDELNNELSEHENPDKATQMSAYMKDKFAFYGISAPERKELSSGLYREFKSMNFLDQRSFVEHCWKADQREFQYISMKYLFKSIKQHGEDLIDLLELMIVNKAWWDTVDFIASNLVYKLFLLYPKLENQYPDKWIKSDNIWLQRTAIIYQLKAKEKTNANRLFDYILRTQGTKEFFINKAAGWGLRQYSKFNPEAVREFIHDNELHPLTVREGSKYLG